MEIQLLNINSTISYVLIMCIYLHIQMCNLDISYEVPSFLSIYYLDRIMTFTVTLLYMCTMYFYLFTSITF